MSESLRSLISKIQYRAEDVRAAEDALKEARTRYAQCILAVADRMAQAGVREVWYDGKLYSRDGEDRLTWRDVPDTWELERRASEQTAAGDGDDDGEMSAVETNHQAVS